MLSTKTYKIFHAIILCTLLIIPASIKPIFTNFEAAVSQSYLIACITSCCIGAALYAFIKPYCCGQPIAILKQKSSNKLKTQSTDESLQTYITTHATDINIIKTNQEELRNLCQEHKNIIKELSIKVETLQNYIEILNQEIAKPITLFKFVVTGLPLHQALYYFRKSKKQEEKFNNLQKQSDSAHLCLTTHKDVPK